MKLYHGTNHSSAVNILKNGIDLKCSRLYLDFGAGFYTTPSYDHAARMAIRATDKYNRWNNRSEEPFIVELTYKVPKGLELSHISYPRHSEKWGQYVLNNRLEPDILAYYNITEHNQDARYDVCYGEIADGSIANIAYQVNHRMLKPEEVDYTKFLKSDGKDYPPQYSFHTLKAISCIKVESCDIIKNKKKYVDMMGGGTV